MTSTESTDKSVASGCCWRCFGIFKRSPKLDSELEPPTDEVSNHSATEADLSHTRGLNPQTRGRTIGDAPTQTLLTDHQVYKRNSTLSLEPFEKQCTLKGIRPHPNTERTFPDTLHISHVRILKPTSSLNVYCPITDGVAMCKLRAISAASNWTVEYGI